MDEIFKIFSLSWWTDANNNALWVVDAILFLLLAIPVAYLLIFALASLRKYRNPYPRAKKQHKFLILYATLRNGKEAIESISHFLQTQDYPREKYDIAVAATQVAEEDLAILLNMPVTIVVPDQEQCTKVYAIQQVMERYSPKEYDAILLLDADNKVLPNTLNMLNDAYYSGCEAIQTHRKAENLNTPTAILSATTEEINNRIFRKAHTQLGFSSALIGSGMMFDFRIFHDLAPRLTGSDLTTTTEWNFLKENIYIEYLEEVICYCKKAESPSEYSKEHRRWLSRQISSMWLGFKSFPAAFIQGKWDMCDKLLQWMMPSRFMQIFYLAACTVVMMVLEWPLSIKWYVLDFVFLLAILMAMPEGELNTKFKQSIWAMPFVLIKSFFSLGKKN